MTACIGWDGPCDVHGQFHGCKYPFGEHPVGRPHTCVCGARESGRGTSDQRPDIRTIEQ